MKNKYFERLRKAAKQHHRNDRSARFKGGIIVFHTYELVAPDDLTRWDDVEFILNNYRVNVFFVHPRMRYHDLVVDEAHRLTAHLAPDDLFGEATPVFKKVGRSRKKLAGHRTGRIGNDEWVNALSSEEARLMREADYRIEPSIKSSWCSYARCVRLCAPVEVRNEADLRTLANLTKRLLKRETTLDIEFPGYAYTKEDWINERMDIKRLPIHALKGTLEKPDVPISIEAMNETIAHRGAGLLKGKLEEAEDFDAPLPGDIQAGFDGSSLTFYPSHRTPEEQAWLDIVPVGREFGSKDYDRLMEMYAKMENPEEKG